MQLLFSRALNAQRQRRRDVYPPPLFFFPSRTKSGSIARIVAQSSVQSCFFMIHCGKYVYTINGILHSIALGIGNFWSKLVSAEKRGTEIWVVHTGSREEEGIEWKWKCFGTTAALHRAKVISKNRIDSALLVILQLYTEQNIFIFFHTVDWPYNSSTPSEHYFRKSPWFGTPLYYSSAPSQSFPTPL